MSWGSGPEELEAAGRRWATCNAAAGAARSEGWPRYKKKAEEKNKTEEVAARVETEEKIARTAATALEKARADGE